MAKRHDVDTSVGVTGAEQYKRDTEKVGKATTKMGGDVQRTGKASEASFTKLNKSFSKFILQYGSVAAIIGAGGQAARAELENMKKAADEASTSLAAALDLMFMVGFYERHPEAQAEIGQMAITSGLAGTSGRVEIAKAWTLLESKKGEIEPEKLQSLLDAALQMRRTTTTDLSTLVNLFQQIAYVAPGVSARNISNLIQQARTEAGATVPQMGQRLPEVLGIAQAADIDVPTITAMFSVATRQFGAEKATTALRNMMMILQGKAPTDAGAAQLMQGMGLVGKPIMQQMQIMAGAGMGLPEYETIFGREAGPLASLMIPQVSATTGARRRLTEAWVGQQDIVGEQIGKVLKPGTRRYEEEVGRRLEAEKTDIQFNLDARRGQQYKNFDLQLYNALRKEGMSHTQAWIKAVAYETMGRAVDFVVPSFETPWEKPLFLEEGIIEWGDKRYEGPKPSGGTIINSGNVNYNLNLGGDTTQPTGTNFDDPNEIINR